jgi:hypothetical protein
MVALNKGNDEYTKGWHDGWTDGYEAREDLVVPSSGRGSEVLIAAAMLALSSGMVGFLIGVALR